MQKINVYLELEKALMMLHMDWTDIEWSHIKCCCYSLDNKRQEVILRPDHSREDLGDFHQNVKDMGNYPDIPDEQLLFGVVVFRNGTWLERRYFDKHWRWHYTCKPEYEAFVKNVDERIETGYEAFIRDADERIETERNKMKQNDKTYTTTANPDDNIYITNNKTGQVTVINRGYEDLP